jgi:hypothetical protein
VTRKKINYTKILANSGVAFFTTLSGVLTADALLNLKIALPDFLVIAFIPAVIQFGLSFCKELGKMEEEQEGGGRGSKRNSPTRVLSGTAQKNWKKRANIFLGYLVFWE